MDNRKIGVFDSGLGGLTVVKELRKVLPYEDIIYFGDTGRVPYGTKGRETIVKYTLQDIRFLNGFHVKAIIIACGTVSTTAYKEAESSSPVPVIGVLRPTVKAAVKATKNGRIGVLGTSATIRSGAYEAQIKFLMPEAAVISKACPMFVPLVENGYFQRGSKVVEIIAREYLEGLRGKVDTLILGCTHYPLLSDVISDIMGPDVTLVNPGAETAHKAASAFEKNGQLTDDERPGSCSFYVSDHTEDFARLAGIFLERPVEGVSKIDIERY